jgi:hypothetical protein
MIVISMGILQLPDGLEAVVVSQLKYMKLAFKNNFAFRNM